MTDNFGVTVLQSGQAVVLVRGEVDVSSDRAFRDALVAAQEASPDVLVDLSDVTFMDSTGINALITAYHRKPEHGSLGVVGVQLAVRRVLEITGLSRFLLVEDQPCALGADDQPEGAPEERLTPVDPQGDNERGYSASGDP